MQNNSGGIIDPWEIVRVPASERFKIISPKTTAPDTVHLTREELRNLISISDTEDDKSSE